MTEHKIEHDIIHPEEPYGEAEKMVALTRKADCHPDRKYYAKGFCRPCYHIYERYRIDQKEYAELQAEANGRCMICEQEFTKTPNLDHDHEIESPRGILCGNCNRMIGLAQDNPDVLLNAAEYLVDRGAGLQPETRLFMFDLLKFLKNNPWILERSTRDLMDDFIESYYLLWEAVSKSALDSINTEALKLAAIAFAVQRNASIKSSVDGD